MGAKDRVHGTLTATMKPTVYVETSVISYLVSRPSRDLVIAAHQEVTRCWWGIAKKSYDLVVSDIVVEEISRGDPDAVEKRLAAIADITVLGNDPTVGRLALEYQQMLGLPEEAEADLYHIAYAVVFELDYLVTWNCAHIANAYSAKRIAERNNQRNRFMPMIVTPDWFEVDP